MTAKTLNTEQYETALLDPSSIFACPVDVLSAEGISKDQKVEILRRWEYDVREEEVAQEENMAGSLPVKLSHVLDALNALHAGVDHEHPAPTKGA